MSYDMFGEFPSGYYPHNPAVHLLNDAGRVVEIMWMIECGWTEQILISHDMAQAFRLVRWGRPRISLHSGGDRPADAPARRQ